LRAQEANAEWERRAFLEAKRAGVTSALENTLQAIKELKDGVAPEGWVPPPEKWLREFQHIPVIANYLAEHPLPRAQVNRTGLSNKQIADDLDANDPKRFGRNVETTAETSFEIKEGKRKNTEATSGEDVVPAVVENQKIENKEGETAPSRNSIGSPWEAFINREYGDDVALMGFESLVGRGLSFGESTVLRNMLAQEKKIVDADEKAKLANSIQTLLDAMEQNGRVLKPAVLRALLQTL
jgi:hypothetical protein